LKQDKKQRMQTMHQGSNTYQINVEKIKEEQKQKCFLSIDERV
jgi:hypothetical protein